MIAALLLATTAALPVLTPGKAPPERTALAQAIDYCVWTVGVREGTYNFPRGAVLYTGGSVGTLDAMRRARIPNAGDVPELVQRFAATQPLGRVSGASPGTFDYARFGGGDDIAWTVAPLRGHMCDVAVTGTATFIDKRDALLDRLAGTGWKVERPAAGNAALWRAKATTLLSTARGAINVQAFMQGLHADADKTGIQMEVQLTSILTN